MQLRVLAAAAVMCLFNCSGVAFASVVTETIDFNNNQMPSGWGYFIPGNTNIHIQDGRLEVGQVDSTGGIFRAFNSAGVSQLVVDYDGNIVHEYWGMGTAIVLANTMGTFSNGFVQSEMRTYGYGSDQMDHRVFGTLNGVFNMDYDSGLSNVIPGSYHLRTVFQDGLINQTITNLGTNATSSSGDILVPDLQLSSMHFLYLQGLATTGDSAWIDNVVITTTSVSEPASLALLGAGLLGLGFGRRKKSVKKIA